ncbi:MAG: phage antirepressor KilAC domain-containing protein, partial [Oscillospiraceae bacterium]|nr:phage antirepressor KilAC domain-containing protein [Oscillospiraceae bacterium]
LKQAEAQLTVALPKAAYFDALVDCPDCTGIRLTAKELGVPQSMFTAYLVRKKYAYYDSKGIMHPHALPYRNGLFVVREFIAPNGHRGTQMLVTPKGKQVFLAERAEIIG